MAHQQKYQLAASSKGIERKTIEKNRRNHMKNLCSQLNSLLPNNNSRGALSRADQIDEAIDYIKSLETRVKMVQEKKKSLMKMKRSHGDHCSSSSQPSKIEIHEMDSSVQIILTCEGNNDFIFKEVIRILHEENLEVKSAHSSLAGNSMLHVVHAEIQQSFQVGKAAMSERLKRFVEGQ